MTNKTESEMQKYKQTLHYLSKTSANDFLVSICAGLSKSYEHKIDLFDINVCVENKLSCTRVKIQV